MRAAEAAAIASGIRSYALMQSAGRAVAQIILDSCAERLPTVVFAGPGNNGGDGCIVAQTLLEHGWSVRLLLLAAEHSSADAQRARDAFEGEIIHLDEQMSIDLGDAALLVDALFGIGLSRPLSGCSARCVAAINASTAQVIAVDIPSGLEADRATVHSIAVRADQTVTFFRCKPAHVLYPAREYCGELRCVDIGIDEDVLDTVDQKMPMSLNHPKHWRESLRLPDEQDHKYRRGHVLIRSSRSPWSTGASQLCAEAALHSGAGMVSLAAPSAVLDVLAARQREVMLHPLCSADELSALVELRKVRCVVIGPGNGLDEHTREMVLRALSLPVALVLDADAISVFAGESEVLAEHCRGARAQVVLTPHTGEFDRTLAPLLAAGTSTERMQQLSAVAQMLNQCVLLKGSDTLIASPGRGVRCNIAAPACLAVAGSGDVLAGIIAALLGQGVDAFDAASAGVFVHAEAARMIGWPLHAGQLPTAVSAVLSRVFDPGQTNPA